MVGVVLTSGVLRCRLQLVLDEDLNESTDKMKFATSKKQYLALSIARISSHKFKKRLDNPYDSSIINPTIEKNFFHW